MEVVSGEKMGKYQTSPLEAYLNGALHCLMTDQDIGIDGSDFIGAFDVAGEEIPLTSSESFGGVFEWALHWLMTDQDIGIDSFDFIGAFDVAGEEFRSECRTSVRQFKLNLGC